MMRLHVLFPFLLFIIATSVVSVSASDDDDEEEHNAVTCGSAVKIKSGKYYLNSEARAQMNVGSGQQIVTWMKENSGSIEKLWRIRPRNHNSDNQEYHPYPDNIKQKGKGTNSCTYPGEPIRCGTTIRITHSQTNKNLHSHNVPSALSRQQEVSAFGQGDGKGDNGDNWTVICDTKYWQRGKKVKLQHVDTKAYLGSSSQAEFNERTCGHNCPLMNRLEAFGRKQKDDLSNVVVEAGIHLYL